MTNNPYGYLHRAVGAGAKHTKPRPVRERPGMKTPTPHGVQPAPSTLRQTPQLAPTQIPAGGRLR